MSIKMQKGKSFERQINKVCEYINNIGGFAHKLCAERTIQGTFIKGEPFDYIILTKDYKAVFDAKEAETGTYHIVKKDIKQINELKKCKNAGCNAYLLICFEGQDVRMIDVDVVIKLLKNNKKSIKREGNPSWDLIKILKEQNKRLEE